ncbi:NAD(P)/FAD-dependent oxidoreductase [Quadrisphaera sp. DSM 44207]|uniref:phytoene desaturase family protein n=1 Tax=Quadrisphaera sp. DSM 44207 TaxID=1881057 RepID=UPI00088C4AEE|nr:phytoene desaturase family protein [Quadrisphaera sp. DSM 44207]SDQ78837.1 phytoene desaturase [Quadrisphaera sp. DSM 44207]
MARVVVVGAGLGGLAAAARLGALGHAVTVCEQAPQVGGKLGWFERDGFAFDTGPSLLTWPQVYEDLFAATGAPLRHVVDVVPVDPACAYRFADGTQLRVPDRDPAALHRALEDALGPGRGDQWAAFAARAERVWEATRTPFLTSPLDGARTLARLATGPGGTRDVATIAPWRSLRGLGSRYLHDPRLTALLDRYATYTGSDPRRAPAALAAVPHLEQAHGSWYVRGGLRRLVEAVADRARERGALVRTGTAVEEVLLEGGRVARVRLAGGERLAADVVVSDADATALYGDLLPGRARPGVRRGLRRSPGAGLGAARARLAAATPSLSGFVLLLALRGRTPGLAHHTVLFPADYDAEFDAVFGTGRLRGRPQPVADPTVYASVPDDPALRPDEHSEAWFVLVNAPRHSPHDPRAGVDWTAPGLADAYADRVLAVMAQRGLDVRERLLWREVRTPADLERETRSVGGSIYGSSSNGARAAFLRPANRSPVPGLFLVGGSAHPGGGIPLVGLSAQIVAGLVGPA